MLVVDSKKRDFILQYILNARLSGRSRDVGSVRDQKEIIETAESLYDQVTEVCTYASDPNDLLNIPRSS